MRKLPDLPFFALLTACHDQDPGLVDAMNGANKFSSYEIPPSTFELKFATVPKAAAKPAARAAQRPAARVAAKPAAGRPGVKLAAKPAAKAAAGRPGSVRK